MFPMRSCKEMTATKKMSANYSRDKKNAVVKDVSADLVQHTRNWYFTKDEIDNHSPSRKDGVDRARESSLRKSYCSFLKDLGMKLRVSPVTTATATMFCHQFYMRQSHAKNDWQTIATACMFLACKVEDNLRPLRDVALVAYEIIYKWDPSAPERIRQREVYYKQKELILDGEHLLLVTVGFEINVQHAFRPLVDALKRIKISDNDVAKVAWNLVNEWLRTTLCLQYKPHYIAAGSLSVAAKLLNFKLPMCEGKAWWLQFDVSPKHLEEVTQQMLRYFNHDGKQKAQQGPSNTTKSSLKVEKNIVSQSSRSDLVSELTNHPNLEKVEVASASSKLQKQFVGSHSDQSNTAKGNHPSVKEAFQYHSSDCCSGISSVVDSESTHTSSKIAHVDNALSKIDVHRLKGAFEMTRNLKRAKDQAVVASESVMDSDLIESELEKGIELEYTTSVKKKQKVSED